MARLIRLWAALCLAVCACVPAQAAPWLDSTPRVAVLSAFPAELDLLLAQLDRPRTHTINGVAFTTGRLRGKPVVMFLSGISMTNAAMNTQLALDRFKVTHLVFSGIAGGVNSALHIGDVTVAERWGQYLEVLMAREVEPGKFHSPGRKNDLDFANFGMAFTRPVEVRSKGHDGLERKFWFDADPGLLAVARRIQDVPLARCDAAQVCLVRAPQVVVGGNGVSGPAFVDNAAFREHTFKTFEANVLDMETAATAMVAYSNRVPFIAFRSLSDLAGGGEGANEIDTFFRIAADNSAKVLLAFFAAWK